MERDRHQEKKRERKGEGEKNERKPKQRGWGGRRWKQANDPRGGGKPGSQELSHTNMSLIVITWEHLVCRC